MDFYTEPQKKLKIITKVDVVVVGAGVAGITAAIASARAGARTILIERSGRLGGIATSTLMIAMGNMFMDSNSNLVVKGIAKELIDACIVKGGWSKKWETHQVANIGFDPEKMELVFIEMLEEAGVEVYINTLASDVIMKENIIEGIIIESKWERSALFCHTVVDCSGEADILVKAGAPVKSFSVGEKNINHGTILFRMDNVDIDRFVDYIIENGQYPEGVDGWMTADDFYSNWKERGLIFFPHGGGKTLKIFNDAIEKGEYKAELGKAFSLNAFGVHGIKNYPIAINSNFFWVNDSVLNTRDISEIQLEARKICHYTADFLTRHIPGFENSVLIQTGNDFGIRVARWVDTGMPFTKADRENGAKYDDVIGVVPAFGKNYEMSTGKHTDIPFHIMIPQKVEGLITGSGKSVDTEPPGIIRGMSRCMTLGQASGLAAAIASREKVSVRDIDIRTLQIELLGQGVNLGSKERLDELGLNIIGGA